MVASTLPYPASSVPHVVRHLWGEVKPGGMPAIVHTPLKPLALLSAVGSPLLLEFCRKLPDMAGETPPGTKRILFGIFLLYLSASIAISEYNELHSGDMLKGLLAPEIWTVAAVLGVLGATCIGFGLWVKRRKNPVE